jgi:hypothetical protein
MDITVNKKLLVFQVFNVVLMTLLVLKKKAFQKNLDSNIKNNQGSEIPYHLKFDSSKLEATVLDYCDRNDVPLQLDELLVIELFADNL